MLVRSILLQARLEHGGQTAWRQQRPPSPSGARLPLVAGILAVGQGQPTTFIYFRF